MADDGITDASKKSFTAVLCPKTLSNGRERWAWRPRYDSIDGAPRLIVHFEKVSTGPASVIICARAMKTPQSRCEKILNFIEVIAPEIKFQLTKKHAWRVSTAAWKC
jgi:hypothetical protein